MDAFELDVNGKKIVGGMKDGVTTLIATIVRGEITLHFSSTSFNKDQSIHKKAEWFDAELAEGQEFKVKVKKLTDK